MMIIPKYNETTKEQKAENRRGIDKIRDEIKRQIENFRIAGYQEDILRFFNVTDIVQTIVATSIREEPDTGKESENPTFDFLFDFFLVIPKNFRSIYDQMSAIGTLGRNLNPLEISDIGVIPNRPYCVYGLEVKKGTGEKQSVDDLKQNNKLGLTEVEIISLSIHFPNLNQYQVFATGSIVGKSTHPFLKTDEKGKIQMLSASGSYSGCGPVENNLIAPTCELRSF